jgi:ribosomal protein S18 acetylase RimI-like enzyme
VPHPWSVSLHLPYPRPDDAPGGLSDERLDAGLDWCASTSAGRGWSTHVSSRDSASTHRLTSRGLTALDALPVLALPAEVVADLRASPPEGIALDLSPSRADVVAAYGAWMQDVPLAAQLVRPGDVADRARRFVVALSDDQPVGCALIWLAAGTVAVSGLGVAPAWRGRGVGAALVATASRLGLQADPTADVVWMHATDEGAGLYRRLGFTLVDEHLCIGAAPEHDG